MDVGIKLDSLRGISFYNLNLINLLDDFCPRLSSGLSDVVAERRSILCNETVQNQDKWDIRGRFLTTKLELKLLDSRITTSPFRHLLIGTVEVATVVVVGSGVVVVWVVVTASMASTSSSSGGMCGKGRRSHY